jgi:capsule polysaccharide export protein KpsE/RkpR
VGNCWILWEAKTSPGSLGGAAASLLGIRSSGDYYVGLLTSNTLFDNIIDRFDLRKIYGKNYYEDARKALTKNAKITSSRKEGFIIIQVTDRIAKRAADLANAFGDELDKLLKTLAANEAKDRLAFLEKERVQASLNLSKAEEVLRTFAEQSGVVQLDTQTKGMLQYIGTLRAEVDAKEVQAQVLRQQATPFNYDVIRVEEEIKSLKEKQLAAESHLDQNCVGDVCLPTSKTPALALEYIRLYREAKFQEGLYQIFSKMVEIARLDLGKNVSLVQVLDRATPPERRFNSRLTSAMGVGFLGFLMAICLAFVREYWLNRPWTEDDTARLDHLHSALQQWRRDVQEVTGRFQRKKQ